MSKGVKSVGPVESCLPLRTSPGVLDATLRDPLPRLVGK
jgi:hypothetical protein